MKGPTSGPDGPPSPGTAGRRDARVRLDRLARLARFAGLRLAVIAVIAAITLLALPCPTLAAPAPPPTAGAPVEFGRDVAPILDAHCGVCHHTGGSAPFSLVSYAEARKHAKEIVSTTQRRYMPPWLPSPGCGPFADARVLAAPEIETLRRWLADGTPEGDPASRPAPPRRVEGWQLGAPDLVVTMPQTYLLQAEGKDVYRNFVFPIPLGAKRFVKGVEFQPGNVRVIHHAFIHIDPTRTSRRLAEKESPAGFDGMNVPETAVMPGGQLLGWQPGKAAYLGPDGLAWELRTNTDVVLQLHLHPSGKVESVQPSIGFYFTDQPPTNAPYRLELVRFDLDVPPDTDTFTVDQSYPLPIDVHLLRISPHSHYIGKQIEGYATFPDGRRTNLLEILDWDFNWQGDYTFAQPIFLPKGTVLGMRFRFDNTTNNVRNPFHPPRRIVYGLQTTDEMAELWYQVLPVRREERAVLAQDYLRYRRTVLIADNLRKLQANPDDGDLHLRLGAALHANGRRDEALSHLTAAVRLRPSDDRAYYELGYFYLTGNQFDAARPLFERVVELNPQDGQAFGSLGIIDLSQRRPAEARAHFETALRLNPDDTLARNYLAQLTKAGY